MTETLATLHTHPGDQLDRRPPGTVGTPLPHVECRIVDPEGRIVPRGDTGELCTRGYGIMQGYWNDPQATAQTIDAAGWMHTGDLAIMDDEGYVRIVGRLKEMIIRAGEKVLPGDVESCLAQHAKVAEVHVFGVPDALYGEELCAWIRLHPGETATVEEMRRYCRGRIATFKIPRLVRFVDQFPKTVTGKVQRFRMRELMRADAGGGQEA
jgi:fatty-acyl-CoA synthase